MPATLPAVSLLGPSVPNNNCGACVRQATTLGAMVNRSRDRALYDGNRRKSGSRCRVGR